MIGLYNIFGGLSFVPVILSWSLNGKSVDLASLKLNSFFSTLYFALSFTFVSPFVYFPFCHRIFVVNFSISASQSILHTLSNTDII